MFWKIQTLHHVYRVWFGCYNVLGPLKWVFPMSHAWVSRLKKFIFWSKNTLSERYRNAWNDQKNPNFDQKNPLRQTLNHLWLVSRQWGHTTSHIQNKRTILWRCTVYHYPSNNLPNVWVMVCERLSITCDRFGDLTYFALKNRVHIEWIHRINLTISTYSLLLMELYLPYQMNGARELWCTPQYSTQYHRFFNWCLVHHEFWKVEFYI